MSNTQEKSHAKKKITVLIIVLLILLLLLLSRCGSGPKDSPTVSQKKPPYTLQSKDTSSPSVTLHLQEAPPTPTSPPQPLRKKTKPQVTNPINQTAVVMPAMPVVTETASEPTPEPATTTVLESPIPMAPPVAVVTETASEPTPKPATATVLESPIPMAPPVALDIPAIVDVPVPPQEAAIQELPAVTEKLPAKGTKTFVVMTTLLVPNRISFR